MDTSAPPAQSGSVSASSLDGTAVADAASSGLAGMGDEAAGAGVEAVVGMLEGGGVVVLSGAGLSTESGIPDYRGVTGSRRRGTPMTYQEFAGSEESRQRYWARSHLGWRAVGEARPNDGHRAVTRLVGGGFVAGVITQNVDGLHAAAGTPQAIELHGSLHHVVCLTCGNRSTREHLDQRLDEANPGFRAVAAQVNPDGDAELADERIAGFRTVSCQICRTGTLKPDVIFFGENVPKPRVAQCYDLVDAASALLVLGSSLTVMSGLRFVRHAAKQGKPVAIVNQGVTRGDPLATARLDLPLGATLTHLADRLAA
ncbi:NAD-dependent protein deacetylase [Actinacidiphila acididurans]|nr:NAD-dependent protein deacetylase [Actinacidiphila acididurans]